MTVLPFELEFWDSFCAHLKNQDEATVAGCTAAQQKYNRTIYERSSSRGIYGPNEKAHDVQKLIAKDPEAWIALLVDVCASTPEMLPRIKGCSPFAGCAFVVLDLSGENGEYRFGEINRLALVLSSSPRNLVRRDGSRVVIIVAVSQASAFDRTPITPLV